MSIIVVTGATGFIGRRVVPWLVAAGHQGRAIQRRHREPHPIPLTQWMTLGDSAEIGDWRVALAGCDVVVNLAGLAHQPGRAGRGRLSEFMRVKIGGPRALVRAMLERRRPMRLVLVSSVGAVASVSLTTLTTLTEAAESRPDTDYGRTMLAGERGIAQFLTGSGVDRCVLRLPPGYGPGVPGNLARLSRPVQKGRPLPLGALGANRSLVYVRNLVDAVAACAASPSASRRTYFLADDEHPSLRELLVAIGQALGRPPNVWSVPLRVLRTSATLFEFVSRAAGRSIGLARYALERLLGSITVDSMPMHRELFWRRPSTMESGFDATFANGT